MEILFEPHSHGLGAGRYPQLPFPLHASHLCPGGLFFFDYMRSDATGHDTPAGLEQRAATLAYLQQRLEIIDGHFEVSERSLARCIGRLKPVGTTAA